MPKRLTSEEFIRKAKNIQKHNDKNYDYSKTKYINNRAKVCIICPKHGEFWQKAYNHLQGHGCPQCAKEKIAEKFSSSREDFIKKAKSIKEHSGKHYDYSKVNYINNYTKVCIICPKHGEFWQTPSQHLKGNNCPKCAIETNRNKKNSCTNEFINKSKNIKEHYGKNYDYSKTEYINNRTKVCIICPKHGEFWQTPRIHLSGGGCPKCAKENQRKSSPSCNKQFIKKAQKIHMNRYNYAKINYINVSTNVCIICPKHGEFWQRPDVHLAGHGCPECAREYRSKQRNLCTEDFVKKAVERHNDKYIYTKVKYKDSRTKVCIICPIHGEFWQTPYSHLQGQGCPKCNLSHLEQETEVLLKKYNVEYETQKKFNWLVTEKKGKMSLDFFLPQYNIGVECQGIQHYKATGIFSEREVIETKQRDKCKKHLCEEHGIRLYYIKYNENAEDKIKFLLEQSMI